MQDFLIKNNRGIALLITITVITLLMAVALELNRKVRTAVMFAATSRDRLTLLQMAYSGVSAAMAMLIKDKMDTKFDSLEEDWANPKKIEEVIEAIPFDEGTVTFKITDELSKIQVNALINYPKGRDFNESQKIMWDRFLRMIISKYKLSEEVDASIIINSTKDWLDFGDDDAITGLNGAESDYYQGLNPSYPCGNGIIKQINEFALVKGVPPVLFNDSIDKPAISNYITVFGMKAIDKNATADKSGPDDKSVAGDKIGEEDKSRDEDKTTAEDTNSGKKDFTFEGKININTADLPVIAAILPSENADLAKSIFDYRQDSKNVHDFSTPSWYKNVPGLSEIQIDPKLITISSDFFSIESVASLHNMKMKVTAVVKTEKQKDSEKVKCRIISWQSE